MSRRTLLIGGGGLVGSRLIPKLLAAGREVSVVGRRPSPRYELPESVTYACGDFAELTTLVPLLDKHDEVIHLAYATVPNTSYDNPLGDLLENLPPTVQLFTEVAARGLRLVLVSSGGTVYGEAQTLPVTEAHPTHPISPYGVTKLTLEKYARLYCVTKGLDVVCVRPANAYGEGQQPFAGQGFVATALAFALRGQPIKIFGQQGTLRDYIHVEDLADGILSALRVGIRGESYNIGTGVGRTNLDVVNAIGSLCAPWGLHVSTSHEAERPFDVHANVLDSTRLMNLDGWRPAIAFDEGLKRTAIWLRNQAGRI